MTDDTTHEVKDERESASRPVRAGAISLRHLQALTDMDEGEQMLLAEERAAELRGLVAPVLWAGGGGGGPR